MTYHFRKMKKGETKTLFQIILERIAWMNQEGFAQWNLNQYEKAYPLSYYETQQRLGNIFVLTENDRIVSGAVLTAEDHQWHDHAPSFYLHHFVSKVGSHQAGKIFLQEAEEYARTVAKEYMRLDTADDNPKLNAYYEALGYEQAGTCTDGPYTGILRQKKLL